MQILHISTNTHGGAGRAAARIHSALLKQNHDSFMIVKTKKGFESKTLQISNSNSAFWGRLIDKFFELVLFRKKYLMYSAKISYRRYHIRSKLKKISLKPDVIILHWIAGFIGFEELLDLTSEFPEAKVFWFLMDMAPVTAGCHYSWGCEGLNAQCKKCPAAVSLMGQSVVNQTYKDKQKFIRNAKVRFLAPNEFVRNQIKDASLVTGNPAVAYIPIDEDIFSCERDECSSVSLLFGGEGFADFRKGGDLFKNVLSLLDQEISASKLKIPKVKILVPGLKEAEFIHYKNLELVQIVRAANETQLCELYAKSDIYICCSREDSGPMMISEALMCGVTVVSFEVGAANELISGEICGAVIPNYDTRKMANKIFDLITKNEWDSRQKVRNTAFEKLNSKSFGQTLASLISEFEH